MYEYPAGYQGVIAVGATDANDELAFFSTRGHYASVAAPGYRILSALPLIIEGINPDEATTGYASWSGTSMSCPFVAGAAALILSLHPEFTPDQVKAQLEKTAVDLGPTGFDEGFGYGRIDLAAALADLVQNDYGAIEITVTNSVSGELLQGVSVIIWQGGKVIETTATNEDGEAIFNSVKAGSYKVTASLTDFITQEVDVTVTAGATTTVTIELQPVLGGETGDM